MRDRFHAGSLVTTPAACDESGLCEEIEGLHAPRDGWRRTHSLPLEAASLQSLVDIAPLTPGHSLICPSAHVSSTFALLDTDEVWSWARVVARDLANRLEVEDFLLLEHGVSVDYSGPSCVRHAHIHVAPVPRGTVTGLAQAMIHHCDEIVEVSTHQEAATEASKRPSHVVTYVGGGNRYLVATPRPGVRMASRSILAFVVGADASLVDWAITAGGDAFRASRHRLLIDPVGPLRQSAEAPSISTSRPRVPVDAQGA